MNRNVVRWGFILFILLSLPALACALVTGDDTSPVSKEEAVESTEDVPTIAAPAETVAPGGGAETGDGEPAFPGIGVLNDALEQFSSYRSQVDMRFEDSQDAAQSGTMTMQTTHVAEPPASSVEILVSGGFAEGMEELGDGAGFSFVEVGDVSYSLLPGIGCISGAAGPDVAGEFDDVLDSGEVLGDIEGATYVGEETVNGVATHHYQFDESNLSQGSDELQQVNGDVYISQEHDYVVRLVFDGVGAPDLLEEDAGEGTVHFEYNVLEVDQPITIEPPADCLESSSDYPVMEGANELATFAGLTTYTVNASLEEVVNFYNEEMAARGYEAAGEQFISEGSAILTYQADGMPDVTVTLGADGETVSVLLTAEEN